MVLASAPNTEAGRVVSLAPDLVGTVGAVVKDSLGVVGKDGALGRVRTSRVVPAPSKLDTDMLAMGGFLS